MTRKRRIEKIERDVMPLWLESLSDEDLLALAGVPHVNIQPLDMLSTEQLIRLAQGEPYSSVLGQEGESAKLPLASSSQPLEDPQNSQNSS